MGAAAQLETKYCNHCACDHPFTREFWQSITTGPQCKVYNRAYRARNLDRTRARRAEYAKQWRQRNKSRFAELQRRHYTRHRDKIIAANAEYAKRRKQTDPNYRLAIVLRQRLSAALRGGYKAGSAVADLGCSIDEFRQYIEARFLPGMSWENHGRHGWHIDHIVPLASFNLSDPDELRKAVHFTNLQPLWAADNIKKGSKNSVVQQH